jgi:hypothetical protein
MGMGMGGAITAVAATTTAGIAVVIVAGGIITTGGIIIIGSDFTPQTIGLRPGGLGGRMRLCVRSIAPGGIDELTDVRLDRALTCANA